MLKAVDTMIEGFGTLFGLALIVAAIASFFGAFGRTGTDYYEVCWEKRAATLKAGLGSTPEPSSPKQSIAWGECEPTTRRAVYDAGFVVAGSVRDDDDRRMAQACPSALTDIPLGGAYFLTLKLLEEDGGPRFWERAIPARFMINRVWSQKWPNCSAERQRQGYAKIVEVRPGEFGWEWACPKCK